MNKYIIPYQPEWQTEFEYLRQVLGSKLAHLDIPADIQHVGSTAVPGMMAKPLLDIDIVIHKKEWLNEIIKVLQEAGYHFRGDQGIAGRYAFRPASDSSPITPGRRKWMAHHLYVCYADSLALKNHLLFRDALRNHPELVKQYTELKKSLTQGLQIVSNDYTSGKTAFIISVLAGAGLDEAELERIREANT